MKTLFSLFSFSLFISFSALAQQDSFAVYFPEAVYRLPVAMQARLDTLFYQKKIQGAKTIAIYGYANEPGGDRFNQWLSAQRANAVMEYLLRSGIGPQQIVTCEGKGQIAGSGSDPAACRVDILKDAPAYPPQPATVSQTIKKIDELQKNETAILQNVLFKDSEHNIISSSLPELEALTIALKSHVTMKVCLEGHVCCRAAGDALDVQTNTLDLSVRRAKAIYDYLASQGIDPSRLSYKGLGASQPIVSPERTKSDQQANRCVVVRVLEK